MGKCLFCGAELDEEEKYCHMCGEPVIKLTIHCPKCNSLISSKSEYCMNCGKRIKKSWGLGINIKDYWKTLHFKFYFILALVIFTDLFILVYLIWGR